MAPNQVQSTLKEQRKRPAMVVQDGEWGERVGVCLQRVVV